MPTLRELRIFLTMWWGVVRYGDDVAAAMLASCRTIVEVPGGTYFFTVAIAERSTFFLVDHIDDLRAAFRAAHAARPFVIDATVILPDHLYCLWTLPEGDADYPVRCAHIKTAFSRRVPKVKGRKAQS